MPDSLDSSKIQIAGLPGPGDSAALPEPQIAPDSTWRSTYQSRTIISKGPSDEIKIFPSYFIMTPGPVGSPSLPLSYLGVAGAEVTLNGLPFPYNGIYRPFVFGADLNAIPWEILNDISATPDGKFGNGLDFRLGIAPQRSNFSDVEVARGPYGYSSSRWRFFRPFGEKTYAYFTLGFKKTDGFITNSDFDGHHVSGGLRRRAFGGDLSLGLWTHRAKAGLNSFDFLVPQESRQSRSLTRSEISFNRKIYAPLHLTLTGLFHRSDQTVYGYVSPVKSKYDIIGGKALISDSLPNFTLSLGGDYFRSSLYGLNARRPDAELGATRLHLEDSHGQLRYKFNLEYAWDNFDQGIILPSVIMSIDEDYLIAPYLAVCKLRRFPDLYTRYLDDYIPSLGLPGILVSYRLLPDPKLKSPILSQGTVGLRSNLGVARADLGFSYNKYESQIQLSYQSDSLGNLTASPVNFDDAYYELNGRLVFDSENLSGEVSGSMNFWKNRFLPGNIEKGPLAAAFARISYLNEFFIPRLYFGGSLEMNFVSRRDYRFVTVGYTDAAISINGRLEFRYKDLTFWLNDDNISNNRYISWWPFYEAPRTVWWGLRWSFFD